MLKMGLPMDALKHALKRDGKDERVMNLEDGKACRPKRYPEGR